MDHKNRSKNDGMRRRYMEVLLKRFPVDNERAPAILSGSVSWFTGADDAGSSADTGDLLQFKLLCQSGHKPSQAFGEYGLNIISKVFSNAIVERFFSKWTIVKNKWRSGLSAQYVAGFLTMESEPDFMAVDFHDLFEKIFRWAKANKKKLPEIRGVRGSYKKEATAAEDPWRP